MSDVEDEPAHRATGSKGGGPSVGSFVPKAVCVLFSVFSCMLGGTCGLAFTPYLLTLYYGKSSESVVGEPMTTLTETLQLKLDDIKKSCHGAQQQIMNAQTSTGIME